ncbi:MAG: hypothetical protein ACT4OX_01915 [Actinomycetota bacterium]
MFWPVGNGDSVTILLGHDARVDRDVVVQIDLHHMVQAEDDSDPHVPVIDRLEEILPEGDDGRPYLSIFAMTHPDQDHCRGFAELLERVTIGELWFTPRVFREDADDLCEDACAFQDEALRRLDASRGAGSVLEVEAGDRVRVFGHDELFDEEPYASLPAVMRTIPGNRVTLVDGYDFAGTFSAFVHAPFKDDADGERNDTSLALQVALENEGCVQRALLFGDLACEVLSKIFERSEPDDLAWTLLLAPHHCSKHAVCDGEGNVREDIVDGMKKNAEEGAWIVSSSRKFPPKDEDGADPPHLVARGQYEAIAGSDHFVATGEHGDVDAPDPIVFAVGDDCGYQKPTGSASATSALASVATTASRRPAPELRRTRWGRWR